MYVHMITTSVVLKVKAVFVLRYIWREKGSYEMIGLYQGNSMGE